MPDWHELVMKGSEEALRAFVAGFAAGRGEPAPCLFGQDLGLEPGSLGERLKALLAAGSHHVLLAPARLAGPLAEAVAAHGAGVGLALERRRLIETAAFAFRIEVFSRELAAEFRDVLVKSLPAYVHVDGFSEEEEIHPEARGPEPFAPLHEYTYRASGQVEAGARS
jgi:hypothetical protein